MRRLLAAVSAAAALALAALPVPALAWGSTGHRLVADIAMANVSPKTAGAIRKLIRGDAALGTPQCRVHSLADAAYWPDCLRAEPARWAYTFPWHYQDEPICGAFDPKANCTNGNCVTAQIERNRAILADKTQPAARRLEALAFLAHFVGDVHQPLHAADDEDHGGNGVRVTNAPPGPFVLEASPKPIVINPAPQPVSLHWFWDSTLVDRAVAAQPSLAHAYSPAERATLATGTVTDWAKESWELARGKVYPDAFAKDPCAGRNPAEVAISDKTAETEMPIVRRRLTQAGLRLAKLLDEALAQG